MAETGHLAQEVRNLRKNGEIFLAFLSASQLKDAQGRPIGVMGVSRDITELKKTEDQTLRAERLAALGQMSAALAHEINNPLQAIRSILDLVLDFPLGVEERENNLNIVRQEIERLSEVTQRVLNFARPARVPRRPASVANILQHTLTLAGKHLQHSHVQVVTELPELAPVLVAPEQMAQVFLNLILNAIEEMHDGGNLKIALRDIGQNAEITFTNDGPAIPPHVMPHIFDPFFTTKPGGSGLGLSISSNLLHQQGGTITAKNVGESRGVVFTVCLPFAPDDAPETTK
jgi:two-component system NtrC family sensor kinase